MFLKVIQKIVEKVWNTKVFSTFFWSCSLIFKNLSTGSLFFLKFEYVLILYSTILGTGSNCFIVVIIYYLVPFLKKFWCPLILNSKRAVDFTHWKILGYSKSERTMLVKLLRDQPSHGKKQLIFHTHPVIVFSISAIYLRRRSTIQS